MKKKSNVIRFRLLIASVVFVCVAALGEERPNGVLFFADDQGTLDANCFGSADLYAPTLDRLAATGVRFARATFLPDCRGRLGSAITLWAESRTLSLRFRERFLCNPDN